VLFSEHRVVFLRSDGILKRCRVGAKTAQKKKCFDAASTANPVTRGAAPPEIVNQRSSTQVSPPVGIPDPD
jgi:hypothetical protein